MNLEELIYKQLSKSKVAGMIATYAGVPAIFYSEVPSDNQKGWGNSTQYPRICYWINMQANQERNSVGTLTISLMCMNNSVQLPEQIEPVLRDCMKDVLLTPDRQNSSYGFTWGSTEAFSYKKQEGTRLSDGDLVIGCDVIFDIIEYTKQDTTDPDPIMALNSFVKKKYPEVLVLGMDKMEHLKVASIKEPVFYARLESIEKSKETNTVVWLDGQISVHLLCSNPEFRMKWVMALAKTLSLAGEVIMLDKSPMRIKRLQINNKADYLKEGQLKIGVYYGLLRYRNKQAIINKIDIKFI